MLVLQGGVYFHNPSLKIVTDQDMRQPRLLQLMEETAKLYPSSNLSENMEIQISSFQKDKIHWETNLAINHKHCVASSNFDDVSDSNVGFLEPVRRQSISILLENRRWIKAMTVNRCRRLYWTFLNNHPVHVPTPARALQDASDALTWFYVSLNIESQYHGISRNITI